MNHQEKKVILLVENDVFTSLIIKDRLEKFGYEVFIAGNGESAVETVLHKKKYDLVLMGIHLGQGLNGLDAAEEILKKKDIPIIFLIDYVENKYFERLKEITCYGCIYKASGEFVLHSSIEIAVNLFNLNKDSEQRGDPSIESCLHSSTFVPQKTEPVQNRPKQSDVGWTFLLD